MSTWLLALSLTTACAPRILPGTLADDPVRPTPGHPAQNGAAGAPVFDAHEWGLIDVGARGARLLAGPPSGPTNWNAPRKKPVVYFHLASGSPALRVNVTVDVPAPGIVEQVPRGLLSSNGASLSWSGLRVRPDSCHSSGASKELPACATPDGICEAADLARYETADAACIEFGGETFNQLFYRADGPAPLLPFDVEVAGDGVRVAHTRANDTVGPILYVHNDGGVVNAQSFVPPAVGQAVDIRVARSGSSPAPGEADAARRQLDGAMRQAGLTNDEIAAFDRAWTNDLFGDAAGKDIAKKAATAPDDYLLFAMPLSLIDGVSRLTIEPAPRTLRRFLLVRLHV